MCLALLKRPGAYLPDEYLRTAWQNNPDGAGYMFADSGLLHVRRGFGKLKKFLKAWKADMRNHPRANFIMHFRLATHGSKALANCHPMPINADLAFVHNGIFNIHIPTDGDSDTKALADHIAQWPKGWLFDDASWQVLTKFCGRNNKLIFLTANDEVRIVNELSGQWSHGVWYSNHSYLFAGYYGAGRLQIGP